MIIRRLFYVILQLPVPLVPHNKSGTKLNINESNEIRNWENVGLKVMQIKNNS
jgi:hypothetical protein